MTASFLLLLALFQALTDDERLVAKEVVEEMFAHAYDNYMEHAFPQDELKPLSCEGAESFGDYMLTLVDSLDALWVLGDLEEFENAVNLIEDSLSFDVDINVSAFETNIRILGALVSGHLLAEVYLPDYSGGLLDLAVDLGDRLLEAFANPNTNIPYGTVNLRNGVPLAETPIVCTACAGSYNMEFGVLSRVTGDKKYERAAKLSSLELYHRRSRIGLYGRHINSKVGAWTEAMAGVGSHIDSFYEYLYKGYILLNDIDLLYAWEDSKNRAFQHLYNHGFWLTGVNMQNGKFLHDEIDNLSLFWMGLLVLNGDVLNAHWSLEYILEIREHLQFFPESYSLNNGSPKPNSSGWMLRPELIESIYYVHLATGLEHLEDIAWEITKSINNTCRVECGFAALKDVTQHMLMDKMESYFLAETLKYLYLIFTPDHPVNTENFLFTTEGHILNASYIYETQKYSEPPSGWSDLDETLLQKFIKTFPKLDPVEVRSVFERLHNRFYLRQKTFKMKDYENLRNRYRSEQANSLVCFEASRYLHTCPNRPIDRFFFPKKEKKEDKSERKEKKEESEDSEEDQSS